MILQIFVSILVLVVLFEVYRSFYKKELSKLSFVFWLIIWCSIFTIVWYPNITQYIATLFNIRRAIDSVVYLSIVIMFYLLFRVLLKLERLEHKLEGFIRKTVLTDEKEKRKE